VDAGVPANLSNDKGDTLVILAAYHGHPQTVTALLKRGADPDRPNDRGQTPLAGATFKGERAVIDALLDGGADPTAGDPVGPRDRPDVRPGRPGRALREPLTDAPLSGVQSSWQPYLPFGRPGHPGCDCQSVTPYVRSSSAVPPFLSMM
jgi:hypothetical protein